MLILRLAENGEMLDALEVVLFQALAASLSENIALSSTPKVLGRHRKAELHAMASFAGDQVRKNGRPFTFGVLNSTERRVIHLALQQEEDLLTESVGDGRDRRLQVRLQIETSFKQDGQDDSG